MCTKFKDQGKGVEIKINWNRRDVNFVEINNLTLFQLLNLVEFPDIGDAPFKDSDYVIDPFTIPGVNHHSVNPKSTVIEALNASFDSSSDDMMFLDLNFSGVLYEILEPSKDSKRHLISFTGFTPSQHSYSIITEDPGKMIPSIINNMCRSSDGLLDNIVSFQLNHKFRFAPNEGLHRLFACINFIRKVLQDDNQEKKDKLEELMKRIVKVVLIFPKAQQPIDTFINCCHKSSLYVESLRKVIAPHTFLDNIKNCFQNFKMDPQFITVSGFFSKNVPELMKGLKIVDVLFAKHLRRMDNSRWEILPLGQRQRTRRNVMYINDHLGLIQVGKRHFINAITKSKQPKSPKIHFRDIEKEEQTELSYQDIALYCILIVLCFSKESFEFLGKCLQSSHERFLSSFHRICKLICVLPCFLFAVVFNSNL